MLLIKGLKRSKKLMQKYFDCLVCQLINYNNDRMQQIEELEFDRKQSQDTAKNNELAIIKLNKQYLKNKKNNKLM